MKKFTAILLAALLVMSLGTAAFAVVSPNGPFDPLIIGIPPLEGLAENGDYNIREDKIDEEDPIIVVVPKEDVKFYSIADADKLSEEDVAAFKAEYEVLKGITDKAVKYFCWIELTDKYADILAESPAYYLEALLGDSAKNLSATVNGKDVFCEKDTEDAAGYSCKLFDLGALAIFAK